MLDYAVPGQLPLSFVLQTHLYRPILHTECAVWRKIFLRIIFRHNKAARLRNKSASFYYNRWRVHEICFDRQIFLIFHQSVLKTFKNLFLPLSVLELHFERVEHIFYVRRLDSSVINKLIRGVRKTEFYMRDSIISPTEFVSRKLLSLLVYMHSCRHLFSMKFIT